MFWLQVFRLECVEQECSLTSVYSRYAGTLNFNIGCDRGTDKPILF